MLPVLRKFKIILKAFGFAVLAWLLLLVLPRRQFFEAADTLLEMNDLFFYKRFFKNLDPHLPAFPELVMIDSVDPLEQRSRQEYAGLIQRLIDGGAACIGIDIRFAGEKERRADSILVAVVRRSPRLVLAMSMAASEPPSNFGRDEVRRFSLPEAQAEFFRFKHRAPNMQLPFDSLLAAAKAVGHINFLRERYDRMPLVIEYDLHAYAALPFEIARLYREHAASGRDGEAGLDVTTIPTTENAQLLVNFVPKDEFEYKTLQEATDLLQANPQRFRDKIVLIVNSGPEIPFVDTPLDYAPYPRWALHASVISQLLQDRHIDASLVLPALLVAVVLLLSLWWHMFFSERFAGRWRRIIWLFIICNSIFVLLAYFGLWFDIWLGVVSPILVYSIALVAIRRNLYQVYLLPEYDNLSISVTESQNGSYPVSITYSPAGEETDDVSFPKFFTKEYPTTKKENFAIKFDKLRRQNASLNDLRELGTQLYEAIFQRSIGVRFMQSLSLVKADSRRLRLRLRLDDPEISRLPWEYMRADMLPAEFIALNRDISVTRYIPFTTTAKLKEYRGPLSILVAIASPAGLAPLDVEAEKTAIKKSLRYLIRLRQVRIAFCEHANLEKLSKMIASEEYDVLHYIGHSSFDEAKSEGFLEFEDDAGERQATEAEALGLILQQSSIRLAVLNSCESAVSAPKDIFFGVAQKLVKVGVPAVVAMQDKIYDDVAIVFAETFYYALLAHYSVDAAVAEARQAIFTRFGLGRPDWGTPVLFMRADGERIFRTK